MLYWFDGPCPPPKGGGEGHDTTLGSGGGGSVSLKKVLHNKYGLRDYTNQALFVNSSNTQFAHYIAGLIEGDGTMHIPKSERSTKGSLNYPSIQIVFHERLTLGSFNTKGTRIWIYFYKKRP